MRAGLGARRRADDAAALEALPAGPLPARKKRATRRGDDGINFDIFSGKAVHLRRMDGRRHLQGIPLQADDGRDDPQPCALAKILSLIHISEPTRLGMISYAVF